MRAHPALVVDGSPLGLNFWAASALFLEPGKAYELRLTMSDPDGGAETRTVSAATRKLPLGTFSGRHLYVVPGSSGGDGSPANPFQGLQSAASSAVAGDVFHISPGTYEPFQLLSSGTPLAPIVFSGPGSGLAIVDGKATDRGIVTLGEWNQTISHVVIEGLTLDNGRWGIDAQNSHDLVIRQNRIRDVDYGVVNRRGDGLEGNQTICDNVIEGRVSWPGVGIPSSEGSISGVTETWFVTTRCAISETVSPYSLRRGLPMEMMYSATMPHSVSMTASRSTTTRPMSEFGEIE